jgi:hypothetical protein
METTTLVNLAMVETMLDYCEGRHWPITRIEIVNNAWFRVTYLRLFL